VAGARPVSETSSTGITHQKERVRTLGHDAVNVDRVDAGLLEVLAELNEALVAVALAHLIYAFRVSVQNALPDVKENNATHKDKATGPGKHGRDRVGRRLVALLVLTVVAGDGAVCGFGLDDLAVRGDELGRHESERAKALRDNVGLNVAASWEQKREERKKIAKVSLGPDLERIE
jgi:hypothetical protein